MPVPDASHYMHGSGHSIDCKVIASMLLANPFGGCLLWVVTWFYLGWCHEAAHDHEHALMSRMTLGIWQCRTLGCLSGILINEGCTILY
jgi:hypothetical protein